MNIRRKHKDLGYMNIKYLDKFMMEFCNDLIKDYKILNENIKIPVYCEDGTPGGDIPCKQTILKNDVKIGGITIEDSIKDTVHIGYIAIYEEEQEKENATNVITLLFCLNPEITKIIAMPIDDTSRCRNSIKFWRKMGKDNQQTGNIEIKRKDFLNRFRGRIIKSNLTPEFR